MQDLSEFKSQIFVETILDDLGIKDSNFNKLLDEIVLNFILSNLVVETRRYFLISIKENKYDKAMKIATDNINDFDNRLADRIKQEVLFLCEKI
ncbi:MAG: hypothetical protein ACP5N7_06410 [Candidatus Pacearchaeota archaeon]